MYLHGGKLNMKKRTQYPSNPLLIAFLLVAIGGQQQRVSIARALATHPDIILVDEPIGELDTTTTHQILSLFQHLVEKKGITVLLATHDSIIDEYADIIFTLEDGLLAAPVASLG
jgi:putative ABC transport system ATP-binding protein